MNDKAEYLRDLESMLAQWEALLAGLSLDQISAPVLDDGWSVKDVVAHLMAWQKITYARLEAGRQGNQPAFPELPAGADPDSDDTLEAVNQHFYQLYRDQPWERIHTGWRDGFQRILETTRAMPESELMELGRYDWLPDYPLAAVLQGTYEHHEDHYGWLTDWLDENSE